LSNKIFHCREHVQWQYQVKVTFSKIKLRTLIIKHFIGALNSEALSAELPVFSLSANSTLIRCLRERMEPLKWLHYMGRILFLPENIRLDYCGSDWQWQTHNLLHFIIHYDRKKFRSIVLSSYFGWRLKKVSSFDVLNGLKLSRPFRPWNVHRRLLSNEVFASLGRYSRNLLQ